MGNGLSEEGDDPPLGLKLRTGGLDGGMGKLMQMAVASAKEVRPDIKLGICGEHGGEPESVKFCHRIGLNYVSCSPFRVPIARLAAAQAAIGDGKERDK